MKLTASNFETVDWDRVERVEHLGEEGAAHWRTVTFGDVRVRRVDYSPGYVADHWCEKGHVVLVLEGELVTELRDGRRVVLGPGMSYHVADGAMAHRSSSPAGVKLFIVD